MPRFVGRAERRSASLRAISAFLCPSMERIDFFDCSLTWALFAALAAGDCNAVWIFSVIRAAIPFSLLVTASRHLLITFFVALLCVRSGALAHLR